VVTSLACLRTFAIFVSAVLVALFTGPAATIIMHNITFAHIFNIADDMIGTKPMTTKRERERERERESLQCCECAMARMDSLAA
jgi:hypothetical protein